MQCAPRRRHGGSAPATSPFDQPIDLCVPDIGAQHGTPIDYVDRALLRCAEVDLHEFSCPSTGFPLKGIVVGGSAIAARVNFPAVHQAQLICRESQDRVGLYLRLGQTPTRTAALATAVAVRYPGPVSGACPRCALRYRLRLARRRL